VARVQPKYRFDTEFWPVVVVVVVVVIAQQLISYHQLSRLRKSATAARLSHSSHTASCQMILAVEQMFHRVGCHSTLRTNIWYASGDVGLVSVQQPTVTNQKTTGQVWCTWCRLTEAADFFNWWDIGWRSSKDSGRYKIWFGFYDYLTGEYRDRNEDAQDKDNWRLRIEWEAG